ncbi:hypothetical protein ACRRTK_009679 [Alexandromys fortis]
MSPVCSPLSTLYLRATSPSLEDANQGAEDQQTKVDVGFQILAVWGKGKTRCHRKKN